VALLLYDNPISSNALKVRLMLAELGLAYDRRTVPFELPRPDWYVAVNSVGGIPALDDDGLVVAESHAILRYLASREQRDDLYPTALRARTEVDVFLDRWALTFRPAFFRHESPALGFVPGKGMLGGAPRPEEALTAAEAIAPTLRLLDEIVGPSGFALGSFTIADVAAAPILFRTTKTDLDLDAYPNLVRWRETLLSRPALDAADPVT
jgi:glutathione S-transferase